MALISKKNGLKHTFETQKSVHPIAHVLKIQIFLIVLFLTNCRISSATTFIIDLEKGEWIYKVNMSNFSHSFISSCRHTMIRLYTKMNISIGRGASFPRKYYAFSQNVISLLPEGPVIVSNTENMNFPCIPIFLLFCSTVW